jgi:hypothetical protein
LEIVHEQTSRILHKNVIFGENSKKLKSWGRCYDHNFRQFSAKEFAFFFLKNNVMIKLLHHLALFRVKNAIICQLFLGENIFKIITSVPGHITLQVRVHLRHPHLVRRLDQLRVGAETRARVQGRREGLHRTGSHPSVVRQLEPIQPTIAMSSIYPGGIRIGISVQEANVMSVSCATPPGAPGQLNLNCYWREINVG